MTHQCLSRFQDYHSHFSLHLSLHHQSLHICITKGGGCSTYHLCIVTNIHNNVIPCVKKWQPSQNHCSWNGSLSMLAQDLLWWQNILTFYFVTLSYQWNHLLQASQKIMFNCVVTLVQLSHLHSSHLFCTVQINHSTKIWVIVVCTYIAELYCKL